MPNRSNGGSRARPSISASAALCAVALVLAACGGTEATPEPVMTEASTTQTTTTQATTTQATTTQATTTQAETPEPTTNPPVLAPATTPPLVAPREIVTPETPPACYDCEPDPEPVPPPSALDARGFPLGTTCTAVSCTSPDGLIFVNPDAVPNPPPGFQIIPGPQLPSTGSSGGIPFN